MLINGDDAVFPTGPLGFSIWESLATEVGWKPSPGKVYESIDFFNINSRTFKVLNGINGYSVTPIPFVNLGLLLGLRRSGVKTDNSYRTIGQNAHVLLRDAPEELREATLACFIKSNQKVLYSIGIPWFIPEHLHGLGLPCIGRFQCPSYHLRFLSKVRTERFPSRVISQWQAWDYARQRLPVGMKDYCNYVVDNSYRPMELPSPFPILGGEVQPWVFSYRPELVNSSMNDLTGILCIEALFRIESIRDLYEKRSPKDLYQMESQIRGNSAKIWRRILRNSGRAKLPPIDSLSNYPKPLPKGDLPSLYILDHSVTLSEYVKGEKASRFHSKSLLLIEPKPYDEVRPSVRYTSFGDEDLFFPI
jgi:hypothetical protein